MKPIDDLDSVRKEFLGNIPDPGGTIADHGRARGLGKKRRRVASRKTRSVKGEQCLSVSSVAAVSMAAE